MEKISFSHVQYSTNTNNLLKNNCFKTVGNTVTQANRDLIMNGWQKWHYAQVNRLGASKYVALADQARKGTNPPRLFSYLLRAA